MNDLQLNRVQQLEHRIGLIQDDLLLLRKFISEHGLNEAFWKKSSASGDEGMSILLNIEMACDLTNSEPLSWGMRH